jgi:hypothetical protein
VAVDQTTAKTLMPITRTLPLSRGQRMAKTSDLPHARIGGHQLCLKKRQSRSMGVDNLYAASRRKSIRRYNNHWLSAPAQQCLVGPDHEAAQNPGTESCYDVEVTTGLQRFKQISCLTIASLKANPNFELNLAAVEQEDSGQELQSASLSNECQDAS